MSACVKSWILGAVAVVGVLGIGGVWIHEAWWWRAELGAGVREQRDGDFGAAAIRLGRLAARWPGWAEVEYRLGASAAALGRVDQAIEAWGRVPMDSEFGPQARLDCARFALERGRLAECERSLGPLLADTGTAGEQAGRLADQVDLYTGRRSEIMARIERRWGRARDQVGLLRLHWQLESEPVAILPVGEALERMGRDAPGDDRVWLGKAELSTGRGEFETADGLLARCEAARRDDADVSRARLRWALASGRADDAVLAAGRLPGELMTASELAAVGARLARLRGDTGIERSLLERRVELEPGDTAAWDRLVELALREGASERAAEARRRKEEVNRARDAYRMLVGSSATGGVVRFEELAKAAEILGRPFEAKGWWSLEARRNPDNAEARAGLERMARVDVAARRGRGTLVDLLPESLRRTAVTVDRGGNRGDPARLSFRDDAAEVGLKFVYENDATPLCRMPESLGGGVGLLDYDGDGWLDVYLVQGGVLSGVSNPEPAGEQRDRLFRNKRDGTFEDVTARSGLARMKGGYGHGVAVGDYDNDGRPDLFVTRWRAYALYHNQGDGTFVDVTQRAGLGGSRDWPTSAAFGDLDGDGDLDLYVCHYTDWDPARSLPCPHPSDPKRHGYCVPRGQGAMVDHLFRNDGGRFVDVSELSGVREGDRDGRGLGVVMADLDEDGRLDIYVANDMTANLLFRNLGGLRFEEVGIASGAGSSAEGGYQAGMGVAGGDLDGDGRMDLAVSNFYGESTSLFHNFGAGQFGDHSAAVGLASRTRFVLGFGISFLDADNDGRLDLVQANGHVVDYRPTMPFAMPAQLFLGTDGGRLVEASGTAGACWAVPRLGRGLAVGDLDNDGREDVLIVDVGQPVAYLHNQGPAGHFVVIKLEGAESNRDGVGTKVSVTGGGRTQVAWRMGGGSYLSASSGLLHFGLGEATRVERVEVRWPSGRVDHYRDLGGDSGYHLREGRREAEVLPGSGRPARRF